MPEIAEEEEDNPNTIDDEETGGEWVTEENLHKFLSHGVVLPIAPSDAELGENVPPTEEVKHEEAKVDDPEFPAFDEA